MKYGTWKGNGLNRFDNKTRLLCKQKAHARETHFTRGETKKGVMVVVDTVGAGKGDIVLVASEGKGAAELLHFECQMPLRSIIIAIVDSIDLEKTN